MKVREKIKKTGDFIWKHKFEISTATLGITLGVIFKKAFEQHELSGYAEFNNGYKVTDEDVYRCIKERTSFLDRINARKMVDMTQAVFAELSQGGNENV